MKKFKEQFGNVKIYFLDKNKVGLITRGKYYIFQLSIQYISQFRPYFVLKSKQSRPSLQKNIKSSPSLEGDIEDQTSIMFFLLEKKV